MSLFNLLLRSLTACLDFVLLPPSLLRSFIIFTMVNTIRCTCGCNTSAEEHKVVDCCVCKKNFIHSCVDLTITEVRTIKTKKGLSWSCRNCNILSNDINELRAAILKLTDDLQSKGCSDDVFEMMLSELSERNDRKQNIIVFNVEEIDAQDGVQRRDHDLRVVRDVLGVISTSIDSEHIEVHRVGRYVGNGNHHRPLKVRLNNVKDVHTVIKNTPKLRNSQSFNSINISFDRTRRQIDYYKKIKAELNSRVEAGATNLRIKYKQGIPTIVSLNQ